MKKGTLPIRWAGVLLALLLMISLFALPVFAEDSANDPQASDVFDDLDEAATETESDEAESESAETESEDADDEAPKGLSTAAIIWIVAGSVVLVAAIVLVIVFREKIAKGLRVLKSEFKKVSWLSGEQTRKSTFVVVVILVIFAAVIGLLDMGLFKLFELILDAFDSLLNGTVG